MLLLPDMTQGVLDRQAHMSLPMRAQDGRSYPHKAILGTACEFATGQRLAPGDFEGGKAGAVTVLGKLGFTIQPLRRSGG
jgi:hypothetical protein